MHLLQFFFFVLFVDFVLGITVVLVFLLYYTVDKKGVDREEEKNKRKSKEKQKRECMPYACAI